MQSSHHLQVETEQTTPTRDASSSKKSWLLMIGCGFGCFALGVASACLVLPSAAHADSLQEPALHAAWLPGLDYFRSRGSQGTLVAPDVDEYLKGSGKRNFLGKKDDAASGISFKQALKNCVAQHQFRMQLANNRPEKMTAFLRVRRKKYEQVGRRLGGLDYLKALGPRGVLVAPDVEEYLRVSAKRNSRGKKIVGAPAAGISFDEYMKNCAAQHQLR